MNKTQASPVAAFRHRNFCLFQIMRLAGTLGLQMQSVAVGWQVYSISGRALDLGYVGLIQFAPALFLALITGHIADRFDRRHILIGYHLALLVCAAALSWITMAPAASSYGVLPIYAVLLLLGTARAFAGPAAQALLPNLLPAEDFTNAVAWNTTTWQVATVVGPALGGLIFGWQGGALAVYLSFGFLVSIALASTWLIKSSSHQTRHTKDSGSIWQRLTAGIHYVRSNEILLGAISLDLFAVLLGGAVALLPVYARDILQVGPLGLGVLRSAPAFGASAMAIFLAFRPLKKHAGKSLFIGVATFGAATCVFGMSTNYYLSLAMLIVIGAADLISVYVRQTLVQLRTPDTMRGRVSAVNQVFIGASNELGEFESGMTANWWGTVPATVIGGIGTLVVVGLWAWRFPKLRRADKLD
jgi:MFS family permease